MFGFNPLDVLNDFFAQFSFWIMVGVWGVIAIASLFFLSLVKRVGGTTGVLIALIFFAGFGGYMGRAWQDSHVQYEQSLHNYTLSQDEVKEVQTALKKRGLYKGEIDGLWGVKSGNAVMALQRSIKEPQTGTLTPKVLAALGVKVGK